MNKTYKCKEHGEMTIDLKADEILKECPICHEEVKRIFKPITSIWNTSGACGRCN